MSKTASSISKESKSAGTTTTKESKVAVTDVKFKIEPYKCNIFYPGAGFDGSYIPDLKKSLEEKLENVHIADSTSKESFNTNVDVSRVVAYNLAFKMRTETCRVYTTERFAFERCSDIKDITVFPSGGTQLNFMGYSYGALVAAKNAMLYTRLTGHEVDHLVLLAAPILKENTDILKENSKIKNILIHDLTQYGDTVYAGIADVLELTLIFKDVTLNFFNESGEKHFHYAKEGEEGNKRRRQYVQQLYDEGLR